MTVGGGTIAAIFLAHAVLALPALLLTGTFAMPDAVWLLPLGNFYEDGDCLAIDILVTPTPIAAPPRVKHGEHKCS